MKMSGMSSNSRVICSSAEAIRAALGAPSANGGDSLELLFSPACRSKPYAYQEGSLAKSFRITLGGIEIEYCQVLVDHGYLSGVLSRTGIGVAAIEFTADNIADVVGRATSEPAVCFEEGFDPLRIGTSGKSYRVGCRSTTGFDVVLTRPSHRLNQ